MNVCVTGSTLLEMCYTDVFTLWEGEQKEVEGCALLQNLCLRRLNLIELLNFTESFSNIMQNVTAKWCGMIPNSRNHIFFRIGVKAMG